MKRFMNKEGHDIDVVVSMFDSIEDYVFLMKADAASFRYAYLNEAALQVLATSDSILGSRIEDVVSCELASRLNSRYQQVIATKKPLKFEETIEGSDGAVMGETALNPIIARNGKCQYVLGIVRDITDRKRHERELNEAKEQADRSKKRLESLVDHNSDAVFEFDLDGNFININDKVTQISGYTKIELIGQSFTPLVVEEHLEKALSNFRDVLTGKIKQFEILINNRKGDSILLDIQNIPIIIDGELEGVYGIAQDITKKSAMEKELIDVKNQLELVWENTSDAIFLLAQDGTVLVYNPSFEKVFGFSEKEIIGVPIPPIYPTHEIAGQKPLLDRMRKNEIVTNLEVQRLTKDGQLLDILASYKPINQGHVLAVATYRDVSNMRIIQRKLEESEKRYRKIVELSPEAIIILKDEQIVYTNKAGTELLGIKEVDEQVDISIWDFIHPEERTRVKEVFDEIERGSELNNYVVNPVLERMIRSDGETIYAEVTAAPIEYNGEHAVQAIFRDVSERIRHEEQLEYMAFHDPLTGLKNRRAFADIIEKSIPKEMQQERMLAVMYLDIDKFKEINDSSGHEIGDELLVEFSKRLEENVREDDELCRIGGDEFLVLLDNIVNKKSVIDIADRLHFALQQPYIINGDEFYITSSFGISLFPKDGVSSKSLIQRADKALYIAKKERNNYKFFIDSVD
ncbi:PAS domain S-box protein [Aquibacillus saliphilus]|uniref:PAS domain S-box protein n=1 Tax=Aquibacillus saliphilus TaxID=1909422 RepID=UPI001CF04FE4|nr:PAS domain S-box protein [Aquibacillus saliphilus]